MEKVLGIGGFFFRSTTTKELAKWYADHLGVTLTSWEQAAGPTAFQPFPQDTKYIGDASHAWMINFRVRDLDAMVDQLHGAGLHVEVDPKDYPYGRFAHLNDPEGNRIELWQPK